MGGSSSNIIQSDENHVDQNGIPELTEKEKLIIRSSWEKLSLRTDDISVDIFLHIFQVRPDVKRFFPFKNAVGDALVNHPHFKGHAMRFINAIKMAVLNLDAWEVCLLPNLLQLGRFHTTIPGFTHDIFEVFITSMNAVWSKYLGREYNRTCKSAWSKIFQFIVRKVEEGYLEHYDSNNVK